MVRLVALVALLLLVAFTWAMPAAPGFINNWQVLGAFDNPEGSSANASGFTRDFLGGEATASPAQMSLAGKQWKLATTDPDGWLSLVGRFDRNDNTAAYVATTLDSPSLLFAAAEFVCDDGAKLWLNGELLYTHNGARSKASAPDLITLKLKPGANLLLAKITQGVGDWGCSLRIASLVDLSKVTSPTPFALTRVGEATDGHNLLEVLLASPLKQEVEGEVVLSAPGASSSPGVQVRLAPEAITRVRVPLATRLSRTETVPVEVRLVTQAGVSKATFDLLLAPKSLPGIAYVVNHWHYDPVWWATQEYYTPIGLTNCQLFFDYAKADPDYGGIFAELDYLKPWLIVGRGGRDDLFTYQKTGQLEIAGGGYCEPAEPNCGAEALARNLIYGVLYKRALFDATSPAGMQNDVFGHTPQFPQLLQGTDHKYSFWSRGNPESCPPNYSWLAPDGSTVLHKREGYGNGYFLSGFTPDVTNPSSVEPSYRALQSNYQGQRAASGCPLTLFMAGTDFTAPIPYLGALERYGNAQGEVPQVKVGPVTDFFTALEDWYAARPLELREISRDQNPYMPGCYTSYVDTKLANRLAERQLTEAESFATIAALLGATYPEAALDKAWRQILFCQHHDAITGSEGSMTYLDLLKAWREANELAGGVLDNSLKYLAGAVETTSAGESRVPVVVFNPSFTERSDAVELVLDRALFAEGGIQLQTSDERPVPCDLLARDEASLKLRFWARDLPAFGYRVYYAASTPQVPLAPVATSTPVTVENDFWRLVVDPARGGCITSLRDRKTLTECLDVTGGHYGNEVLSFVEDGTQAEAPWSIYTTGQHWSSANWPAQVSVEFGRTCTRVIITSPERRGSYWEWAGNKPARKIDDGQVLCALKQELLIYPHSPVIHCKTTLLNYSGTNFLYKIAVPALLAGRVPLFEERFYVMGRDFNTEPLNYTLHASTAEPGREYPTTDFAGIGTPASLTVAGKPVFALSTAEVIAEDTELLAQCAEPFQRALVQAGITCTPTLEAEDHSPRYYRVRFVLATGSSPLTTSLLEAAGAKARETANRQLQATGQARLVVPGLAGSASVPCVLLLASDQTSLRALVDQIAAELALGSIGISAGAVYAELGEAPKTGGLVLLNRWNGGAAIEQDGLVTLSLLRSSTGWPSTTGYNHNFEASNWTERFEYGLLPFTTDWREAEIVRLADDYNRPLLAQTTEVHAGPLPTEQSFARLEAPGALMASLKPAGYQTCVLSGDPADPTHLALRAWDSTGRGVEGRFQFFLPLKNASLANLLEAPLAKCSVEDGALQLNLSACQIGTWLTELDRLEPFVEGVGQLGDDKDPIQPIWSRYWQYSSGTWALGGQPVSVALFEEEGKVIVCLTNDQPAKPADVELVLVTGDPITHKLPSATSHTIPARGRLELSVEAPADVKVVRATIEYENQHYTDVLVRGSFDTPAVRFTLSDTEAEYEELLLTGEWAFNLTDSLEAVKPDSALQADAQLVLSRYWEGQGFAGKDGRAVFRKLVTIPETFSQGQLALLCEGGVDDKLEVYLNGQLAGRYDGPANQRCIILMDRSALLVDKLNLIALRVLDTGGDGGFAGPVFLMAGDLASLLTEAAGELVLHPGQTTDLPVQLRNTNPFTITGELQLLSPIQTWPGAASRELGDLAITPAVQPITLEAGESKAFSFQIKCPGWIEPGTYWCVARLGTMGRLSYSKLLQLVVEAK